MNESIVVVVPGEGLQTSVAMAHDDSGRFVVVDACWFVESFAYGDTVELRDLGDGTWEFVRVVSLGHYDTQVWTLPKSAAGAEDVDLEELFDEVRNRAGYAERALGGLVFTALPAGTRFDTATLLRRILDRHTS